MIFSILFDGLLHQTGKGWQHIDWRIDLLVVQLPIDEDLPLRDIACQVGDRMGDIIVLS